MTAFFFSSRVVGDADPYTYTYSLVLFTILSGRRDADPYPYTYSLLLFTILSGRRGRRPYKGFEKL